ncbi:MAG: AAA family ATPase, partial [Planctomycetaceae bacterium]
RAQCPGHDGDGLNLAVSEGADGTLLLHCHSRGCTADEICEGLDISVGDLFPNGTPGRDVRTKTTIDNKSVTIHATSEAAIEALAWSLRQNGLISESDQPAFVWDYRNVKGDLVGRVIRWNTKHGKEIRQIRRHGTGWVCKAMDSPRPLYRLPTIIEADTVYVCEGEKAADAVVSIGLVATSPSQGSKSPQLTDWQPLNGKRVVILPDRDEPGAKFVESVIGLLRVQAPFAGIVVRHLWDDLPSLEESGDAHDWSEHYDSASPQTLQVVLDELPDRIDEYTPKAPDAATETTELGATGPIPWEIKSVWDAARNPQPMREVIIEGLARRGEVMNIVASTKAGKSWMALGMLFSISAGLNWLNRATRQGRALLIDNELHDETIQNRAASVLTAMGISPDAPHADFDYVDCRGETVGIEDIEFQLSQFKPGELTVVVLDAKYRFFAGMDENSNYAQTEFHNAIDRLAKQLDCVIVLVHHATKGNQGSKAVTDIGSGGGAQSRAVDCHLTIRPHEDSDELAVLDAAVRTFAPVESQTLRWSFPIWTAEEFIEPAVKQATTRNDARIENATKDKAINIVEMLVREPFSVLSENTLSGGHPERKSFRAAIRELEAEDRIKFVEGFIPDRRKKPAPAWKLIQNGGS